MNKKLLIAIAFLMLYNVGNIQAQSHNQQPLQQIVYNENIKNPLSLEEKKMLQEVYADKLEDYILNRPNRLKSVKNILRNRVHIIDLPTEKLIGLKKLSEIPLFNPYNPDLKRDVNINQNTFNPLKYQFDFYSRHASFIRIDNTNSVIQIKSQFQK